MSRRSKSKGSNRKLASISKMNPAKGCKAFTKSGNACRAAATPGGLCFFHANPNKAAELGRIGGRNKGRIPAEIALALPNLDTAAAVTKALEQLIQDLYAGKIDHKVAATLAGMMNMLRASKEAIEMQSAIAELRKQLAEAENSPSKVTVAGEAPPEPRTTLN
jgi:hypothetical protein